MRIRRYYDISEYSSVSRGDIKHALGVGRVKLRSWGSIEARRDGNNISINGIVDHSFKDLYDFNKDDYYLAPARAFSTLGSAKPFLMYGSKTDKITGQIIVGKNGKVTEHKFTWKDVDQ